MSSESVTGGTISPVIVLSIQKAPTQKPVDVHLHYFAAGEYKRELLPTAARNQPDQILISSAPATLPPVTFNSPPWNSPKNIARAAYYAGRKALAAFTPVRHFSTPVLDLRHIEPNNLSHLLLDIIPRYLLACEAAGPDLTLLFCRQPVGRFAELLKLFNIEPVVETGRVSGNIVKIHGLRGLSVCEIFDTFDCYGLNLRTDIYCDKDFATEYRFDRIYISRRENRTIHNPDEIETLMAAYGYKTIFMEDYSLADQLGIASKAKHVIAVHGAGMSPLMVSKHIDSIIEFFPPHIHHEIHATMLSERVDRYDQILPEYDPRAHLSGWEALRHFKSQSFDVNTTVLEAVLQEIHGPNAD